MKRLIPLLFPAFLLLPACTSINKSNESVKVIFDTDMGTIKVNPDGSNGWENNPDGKQIYVIQKMPVNQMSNFIEARMMHVPVSKN